jgi:hypothetical protein
MGQGENLDLALGTTQQYFRQKYMPLQHVQLRIWIWTIRIETSIFYQTLKLQLKHFVNMSTSKLVWDCHQSLTQLARHSRVQLIWVSNHEGILLEVKQQIYWQEQDLNICSHDLNQPVASQSELPREWSETGQIEITSNNGTPHLDSNRQRNSYQDLLPEEQMIC